MIKRDAEASYEAVTRGIRVTVVPVYLEEQSDPDENSFIWAYTIVIENQGGETIQLRTRHWRITDFDRQHAGSEG